MGCLKHQKCIILWSGVLYQGVSRALLPLRLLPCLCQLSMVTTISGILWLILWYSVANWWHSVACSYITPVSTSVFSVCVSNLPLPFLRRISVTGFQLQPKSQMTPGSLAELHLKRLFIQIRSLSLVLGSGLGHVFRGPPFNPLASQMAPW